jgi:hypothetical protein
MKIFFSNQLLFFVYRKFYNLYFFLKFKKSNDIDFITNRFYKAHDYGLNLINPQTLNEKLQWLKIFNRQPLDLILADKIEVKRFISNQIGEEYVIPTLSEFSDSKQIYFDAFPNEPFIIKANHDSGSYMVVRNNKDLKLTSVRNYCKFWLNKNYYYACREYQYFPLKPKIIIEKLLLTENGKIPDDYKFNVINGSVEFIYIAHDREGINSRLIYSKDWVKLDFTWSKKNKTNNFSHNIDLSPPAQLNQMIEISENLGKFYPYLRVDMYLVGNKIYIGELTQCHGGGFDKILPFHFDEYYGSKLHINA